MFVNKYIVTLFFQNLSTSMLIQEEIIKFLYESSSMSYSKLILLEGFSKILFMPPENKTFRLLKKEKNILKEEQIPVEEILIDPIQGKFSPIPQITQCQLIS